MSSGAVSSLIRAALFVADLDRAARFYEALGLTGIYFEGVLDGASAAHTLGVPASTVTRCRILKRPGTPNFGMVGLFELTHPAPPALSIASDASPRRGEVALVFYCDDVAGVRERLLGLGATAAGPVAHFQMPHRSQNECCLRDPDGVLINLVERPADEQFKDAPVQV